MLRKSILCLILLVAAAVNAAEFRSPNGKLVADVKQDAGKNYIVLTDSKGQTIMRTQLGLLSQVGLCVDKFVNLDVNANVINEKYTNIHGKRREVSTSYRSAVAHFKSERNEFDVDVELRLYDDGLVFRYAFDYGQDKYMILDEFTSYEFPAAAHRWLQRHTTCYEGDFPYQAEAGQQGAWNYPALFEQQGTFVLLTESNVSRVNCATHLSNEKDANVYKVTFPYEWEANKQGSIYPTGEGKWTSPWRVAIVGELKDIVQSTLVEDVADATTMSGDLSWIKPGRAAWIYWAYNHGTKDYKTCCEYVDLAVEMGWEYVLLDWEWDAMTNGGKLEDAVAYALSKGIKPWMWYNSGGSHTGVRSTPLDRMFLHKNRVEEFKWLRSLGVVGVKIDFFESDKPWMMGYYLDILKDAADFQMMVNFHGCTLPRGWSRTYPHLMSQEAVYGAEQYNNSPNMTKIGSRINCLLPYTRNVVGPMDYTPVAFTDSQHPHETSFAHELALSVAFESGVQHWADRPAGFYNLPEEAKNHMKQVPVVWDEIRFISGYPGESFVVARRSGSTWYIAGLNGTKEACKFTVPFDFLSKGKHRATLFADGSEYTRFDIKHLNVTNSTSKTIKCLPQGGFLMVIK